MSRGIAVDPEDVLGAGVEAAAHYISRGKFFPSTLRNRIMGAAEAGMQQFILEEQLHQARVETDTGKLEVTGYDHQAGIDHDDALEVARERIEKAIHQPESRNMEIFRLRKGLEDGREWKAGEIAKKFEITSTRVKQIIVRIEKRLRNPVLGALLKTSFDELSLGMTYPSSDNRDEAARLHDALLDIAEKLGISLDMLRKRLGLTNHRAASFLSDLYPDLPPRSTLKLVSLSDRERAQLEFDRPDIVPGLHVHQIRRSLRALTEKADALDRGARVDIRDQLREIYFPLFISDRPRCLELLAAERDSHTQPDTARGIFGEVHGFFANLGKRAVPGLKSALDSYQLVDIEIAAGSSAFLNTGEQGTGKSVWAIAYALLKGARRVLFISTKSSVHSQWPKEIHKHVSDPGPFRIVTTNGLYDPAETELYKSSRWLGVTYATAAKNIRRIRDLGCDLIVLDECHKVNNEDSFQSRNVLTLEPPMKLAMSGSPFKNKRLEMFPVLNWLYPDTFISGQDFFETYCKDATGVLRLQQDLRPRMVCRFQDQVMKLPKVNEHRVEVAFDKAGRDNYENLKEDFISWLKNHGQSGSIMGSIVAFKKLHALRRAAIEPKIPAVVDLVKETTGNDDKIVLYTTYLPTVSALRRELKEFKPLILDGRSTAAERTAAVDTFHGRDDRRVFIVTAAGAESIDLTAASTIGFVNLPYTHAERDQMLKRLQRRGQKRTVHAYTFTTVDTVEERVEALVKAKGEEHNQVLRTNPGLGQFFEESEKENVRELVADFLRESKGKPA